MKKNKKQEKIRKILSKLDKEVLRISVQAELKNSEETGVRKLMQTMPPVGVPNRLNLIKELKWVKIKQGEKNE